MNARRNVPNVDGAFTPGSTFPTAPSRNPSMSAMLSPPVSIPATIEDLRGRVGPRPTGTVTILVTNDSSPASRANRITGTNPAEGTRFTSSKVAVTFGS